MRSFLFSTKVVLYWQGVSPFSVSWCLIYCWRTHVVFEVGKQLCVKVFQKYLQISTLLNRGFFFMFANFKCKHMFLIFCRIKYFSNFFPEHKKMLTYIICSSALTESDSSSYRCSKTSEDKHWFSNRISCKLYSYFHEAILPCKKNLTNDLHFSAHNKWVDLTPELIPMTPRRPNYHIQNLPTGTMWNGISFCLTSLQYWGTADRTLKNVWLSSWFKHHLIGLYIKILLNASWLQKYAR